MADALKKAMEMNELLKAASPSESFSRSLKETGRFSELIRPSGLEASLKLVESSNAMGQALIPIWAMEHSASLARLAQNFAAINFEPTTSLMAGIQSAFLKPEFLDLIAKYQTPSQTILNSFKAINTSWLNTNNFDPSLLGFSRLNGLSQMIASLPSFDDDVVFQLRDDLGDYRDRTDVPEVVEQDLEEREEYYAEAGFDADIVAHPDDAIEEVLEFTDMFRFLKLLNSDQSEFELMTLTHKTQGVFFCLERKLRQFVTSVMLEKHGAKWVKQKVPQSIRERWLARQNEAKEKGRPSSELIEFADFGDYVKIICNGNNWPYFEGIFRRKEDIQESFNRIAPCRNDVSHARIFLPQDVLLVISESNRILKAIASN